MKWEWLVLNWFWVGFGTRFTVPSSEQVSKNSPTKSPSIWGVYRYPSLNEVKRSETVAQGRQDTPSDTGKSTNAVGVSHLFDGCTESHDSLPNADV